ncbi:MAG: DEAD/DEAH box helicase, partial [Planctomycetota bacterium]
MTDSFPTLKLQGQLRPSQADVIDIARKKLQAGQKRLHIVAPPGSGKTILGLYLWAECVRVPTLVLAPNSAIQAQWAAKTSMFTGATDPAALVSTDPRRPALLTSLTYQSVTLPKRAGEDLDEQAKSLWKEALIAKGQAQDPTEAEVWIADLLQHNPNYYQQRLSSYRKQVRDQAALAGEALGTLHDSARATLERLRDNGLGLIIFDECHHLMEHWGRVLAAAHDELGTPMIVGLTATPPDRDGKNPEDVKRYDEFFGPIDYEVPVPAVVKDGFLAPYQDLAYFVRPTADELTFVARSDEQLQQLVHDLGGSEQPTWQPASTPSLKKETAEVDTDPSSHQLPTTNLPNWLLQVLAERRLPLGQAKDWSTFERRDPDFALAARLFLLRKGWDLPADVPEPALQMAPEAFPTMNVLVPVLDRYVRHQLRRSPRAEDRDLADTAVQRLRMLGVQITETGCQACASPVGRVMAYSRSKVTAVPLILATEHAVLGSRLRAIVVADYEKSSATTAEISHLLDEEAGGAVAAFKTLLKQPETDLLNPILVTGSSVLVDDDLKDSLHVAALAWLKQRSLEVELQYLEADGFHVLNGQGSDWCPRVYVEMITELFQQGLTQCLVGTRGLLGEGWDANKVNVLVDLTTVTTSMTVNQLRGRSIRLDPAEPQKVANNWDIICLAPEFTKGLDDYKRFMAKHETLYGVTDDGAVEKGVGHVHPTFTELKPEGVEDSVDVLNQEMLSRAARRAEMRTRWKIGEPYRGEPKRTIEARPVSRRERGGFPPFKGAKQPWNDNSLALAIGNAILGALREAELIPPTAKTIAANDRGGGFVRLFLEQGTPQDNQLFTESLQETLAPLGQPRYVIPRQIVRVQETFLSRTLGAWLPRIAQPFIEPLKRRQAERVMWHAVPTALAKNQRLVAMFQKHWNLNVSPGEAKFTQRGAGEGIVEAAIRSEQTPESPVH